jgi:PAS domain S-box-containing protein
MRIAPKIALLMGISVAIVMSAASWVGIQQTEISLYSGINQLLRSNLDFMAEELNEQSMETKRTAEVLAHSPSISRALSLDVSVGLNAALNQIPEVYPFFNYVMVVTLDGEVFAVNTLDSHRNRISSEELLGFNVRNISSLSSLFSESATVIGNPGPDPFLHLLGIEDRISQWFVTPVFKKGGAIGWVAFSYNWQVELEAQLTDSRNRLESQGNPILELALYNASGKMVVNSLASTQGVPTSADQLRHEKQVTFGKSAMKLVIASDRSKLNEPVARAKTFVIGMVFVTTMVLLGAVYLILQRTVLAKIKVLQEGSHAFESGNLAYRLPPMGNDELGRLGATFNNMGMSLENARHGLERAVSERTAELKRSEERWQFALEGAREGVWDWNAETNEVYFSPQWKSMLGFEEHEVGNTLDEWDKRVHPDDKAQCYIDIQRHFSGETPYYENEHRVLCKDGSYKWILDRGMVMERSDDGKPLRVIGTHTDVTGRRLAEQELLANSDEIEDLYENAPCGYHSFDENGVFARINNTELSWLGYTREEMLGKKKLTDILTPESVKVFENHFPLFRETGQISSLEMNLVRKDGSVFPCLVNATAVRGESGQFNMSRSTLFDITERKLGESRLAELGEFNQQIIDNSPIGICIYRADGQCVGVNDSAAKIVGAAKDKLMNDNFKEIKTWQDSGLMEAAMDTMNSGAGASVNIHMTTTFGAEISILAVLNRFYMRGEPHLLLMFSDVSDVKNAERMLRESNERLEERVAERSMELIQANRELINEIEKHAYTASALRDSEKSLTTIIESSPIAIFVVRDQQYRFVNKSFKKILFLGDSVEVVGKDIKTPYADDSGKQVCDIVNQCIQKSEMVNLNEIVVTTRDRQKLCLNIWLQPITLSGVSEVIGFMIDVSEQIELRSHLNQSQKMEALGSLAGGIAHDFNNILYAITGYTELALDSGDCGDNATEHLDQVLKAAQRAADLVKHILTFSRQTNQEKKPLLIGLILKESLDFLRASITRNIDIHRHVSNGLHQVNADPTQIHQVIMNLVTNAYHSMKDEGGSLDVTLDEVELTEEFVSRRPGMIPGTYQRLKVSDTGHGMDRATQERIFDPYFTTKEVGQGTGLGLSVVHSIVTDHGGAITVESVPGVGSTFEVYFPIIIEERKTTAETKLVASRGTATILFVDDEPMLTHSTKLHLERLGYKVLIENDPIRALAAFEARPQSFDLVITDMSMPKMTGLQLCLNISRIRKDIPIILITGFSDQLEGKNLSDYGISSVLQKPMMKVKLAQIVHSVLSVARNQG